MQKRIAEMQRTPPEMGTFAMHLSDYKKVDGTSFAAPIVTSVVAQMLEAASCWASSTMSTTFLRPAQAADVVTISRVIRRGKHLLNAEAWLFSHAVVEPNGVIAPRSYPVASVASSFSGSESRETNAFHG